MNIIIANYTLMAEVKEGDLHWLLNQTPAHVVVVVLESRDAQHQVDLHRMLKRSVGKLPLWRCGLGDIGAVL